jgi:hypothetical protein
MMSNAYIPVPSDPLRVKFQNGIMYFAGRFQGPNWNTLGLELIKPEFFEENNIALPTSANHAQITSTTTGAVNVGGLTFVQNGGLRVRNNSAGFNTSAEYTIIGSIVYG